MIIIVHKFEYDEKAIQSYLTCPKGGMVKEHTSNRSTAVYYMAGQAPKQFQSGSNGIAT